MAGASDPPPAQGSSLSFTQGFLLGQVSISLLIFCFIKFFIFGEPPPADERALHLSTLRRQRTLAHQRSSGGGSSSQSLRRRRSITTTATTTNVLRNPPAPPLTTASILEKTYYNVQGHQPESLDWFNVLFAQTIAQLRADARHDNAILKSLTDVLNGPAKPDWVGPMRVTEINLGEEFPIFSNCRIIPVEEGMGLGSGTLGGVDDVGGRLQARMDVDLSDVITLGVETTLELNWPKPRSAVLPVALAVSIVRFSGTLSVSFIPSHPPSPPTSATHPTHHTHSPHPPSSTTPDSPPHRPPTTLAFHLLDDYRLDLSVRSLLGSRSRLQDVPKIAQLVEARIHAWFDERVVEPRFQQIVLPSLWPRMRNTRGRDDEGGAAAEQQQQQQQSSPGDGSAAAAAGEGEEEEAAEAADTDAAGVSIPSDRSEDGSARSPSTSSSSNERQRAGRSRSRHQRPSSPSPPPPARAETFASPLEARMAEEGRKLREAERAARRREEGVRRGLRRQATGFSSGLMEGVGEREREREREAGGEGAEGQGVGVRRRREGLVREDSSVRIVRGMPGGLFVG